MREGFVPKTLRSYDGTTIAYQVRGSGGKDIVLANGLGGNWATWHHLYRKLDIDEYRVISWDYRGTFNSGRSPVGNRSIESHVLDLVEILKQEQVIQAVFFGWSMGVQVVLELQRHYREKSLGLVLLNGSHGHTLQQLRFGPLLNRFVRPGLKMVQRFPGVIGFGAHNVANWESFIPLMQRFGFVARSLDKEIFAELVSEYTTLDFAEYARLLLETEKHSAADILNKISCPVLIITAEGDMFTPLKTSRMIQAQIPQADLLVVPGATHYAAVEKPELVMKSSYDFIQRCFSAT